jgi:hypothetical protein
MLSPVILEQRESFALGGQLIVRRGLDGQPVPASSSSRSRFRSLHQSNSSGMRFPNKLTQRKFYTGWMFRMKEKKIMVLEAVRV